MKKYDKKKLENSGLSKEQMDGIPKTNGDDCISAQERKDCAGRWNERSDNIWRIVLHDK